MLLLCPQVCGELGLKALWLPMALLYGRFTGVNVSGGVRVVVCWVQLFKCRATFYPLGWKVGMNGRFALSLTADTTNLDRLFACGWHIYKALVGVHGLGLTNYVLMN